MILDHGMQIGKDVSTASVIAFLSPQLRVLLSACHNTDTYYVPLNRETAD
jgi:hypothetical protein